MSTINKFIKPIKSLRNVINRFVVRKIFLTIYNFITTYIFDIENPIIIYYLYITLLILNDNDIQ